MRKTFALIVTFAALTARADDWLDPIEDHLSFSAYQDQLRGKFSGYLDLEAYHFETPAPGFIYTDNRELYNARLVLFFDAQIGSQLYVFAQGRVDRGFDPGEGKRHARLDEYAIRYTPDKSGRFSVQVGRFATVVGSWVERHLSWDNPFLNAPLPYEQLTAVWDVFPPGSVFELRGWAHLDRPGGSSNEYFDKRLRTPIFWGPVYATGGAVSGKWGHFEYAAEVKDASLSSRPEAWSWDKSYWEHPTVSGRIGYRPSPTWNFGLSGSQGAFLLPTAKSRLPSGYGLGDYRETVFGQDASFAWRHLQLWAEAFQATFTLPRVGDARVYAYYLEAKQKFTPQFSGALRWNEEWFDKLTAPNGARLSWGRAVQRLDAAAIYRFSAHIQLKAQYSVQHENGWSGTLAGQLTVRF